MIKEKLFGEKTIIALVVLFVLTVATVTICSKCSPIYPLNNWDDTNCFFTVGKSIANGKVLYRDIFEQKGPLLYFIYSIAYHISNDSFFGVYLIEILFGYVFLFFAWKTMSIFIQEKALFFLPVVALLVYGIRAFQMGGSAEELCLPMVMFTVYTGTNALKNNTAIKKCSWFLIGIAYGAVFWIKYSLIGFFIGLALFFFAFYIKVRSYKEILFAIVFSIIGIVVVTMPVIIYCVATESFSDLLEVYFYTNIFAYSKLDHLNPVISKLISLFLGALSMMKNNTFCLPLFLCIVIYFVKTSCKRLAVLLSFEFLSAFVLIYFGGRRYAYYSLILCVFIPVGVCVVYMFLKKHILTRFHCNIQYLWLCVIAWVVCEIAIFFVSPNTYMLKYKKEDLAQYQFAEQINETINPTLLIYGFMDVGFYTTADIIPNCRYFCSLNVNSDIIRKEHDDYIAQKKVQYIITIDKNLAFDGYTCVCEAATENRCNDFVYYYLYRKNE